MKKHSIFINLPAYQSVVDELAAEVGNPTFMPHVTLAGHLIDSRENSIKLASMIAEKVKPLTVYLEGFGTQAREFRFFCILAVPSDDLRNIYKTVHSILPSLSEETFKDWPHASLLYGTISATSLYKDIDALMQRFGTTLDGSHEVNEISLWETEGPVESWMQIAKFKLGLSDQG